jgi:hypothetical protein
MTDYKILLSILLLFVTVVVFAQGAPPATPIDGGLSLLLAAGGAYGIKKLMKNKKH